MTFDEIRKRAAELGLDPEKLTIYEPYWASAFECEVFSFEYNDGKIQLDYKFAIPHKDMLNDCLGFAVRYYVEKGLQKLAEKITKEGKING